MRSAEPSSPDEALASMRSMAEVVELLHSMPKLTIAAVNGPCAGAGLSLAAACGMRIAARSAVFLTSYIEVGQSGDYGQAWFLERLIGAGWTARLQLLSERIDWKLRFESDLSRRSSTMPNSTSAYPSWSTRPQQWRRPRWQQLRATSTMRVSCRSGSISTRNLGAF